MDVLSMHNAPEVIAARTGAIHRAMLRESRRIRQANFEAIAPADLSRLFELYDRRFCDGWLGRAVAAEAAAPLGFRISTRMTRAGGKTSRYEEPARGGVRYRFEIAVAARMLLMTFRDVQRTVIVCGLTCTDRLQALQRIMEHEIIHLTELLVWGESRCSQPRFKKLVRNIFGHTDTRHGLVTPRERAAVRHGVNVGGMVEFEFRGRRLVGRVNRISRRATVLVADVDGPWYSDGGRYQKFYVPLDRLRPAAAQP